MILLPWRTFTPFLFFTPCCVRFRSPYGTDGRTDGRARRVSRPNRTVAAVMRDSPAEIVNDASERVFVVRVDRVVKDELAVIT